MRFCLYWPVGFISLTLVSFLFADIGLESQAHNNNLTQPDGAQRLDVAAENDSTKCCAKKTKVVPIPPCPPVAPCVNPRIYNIYTDYVFGRGLGYNEGYSTLGFFTAPRFSGNWLPFVDFRGHVFNDGKWAANGGFGARYFIDFFQIFFGMNGFYDYRRYKKANFNEAGLGVELLGNWVAFRANGYIPFGRDQKIIGYSFNKFQGNQLIINESAYLSMWGVDGELEARVFSYKGAEFQLAAGPYYYKTKSDFDKDMVGGRVKGSLQFRKFLYASATTTFDRIFNWRWQGEVGFNIPFGPRVSKACASKETINSFCSNDSALLRRASSPVERQEIIVISKQKRPLTALDPSTGLPLVFWHVNNLFAAPGAGTFESPFPALATAQSASNAGDTILVNYGNGSSLGYSTGITLKANQHLIGTAIPFLVSSSVGDVIVPALTPNRYPTITNAGASIVTLSNNNEVAGLNLSGGLNGIFGSNIQVAPYIHHNLIFNIGAAVAPLEASIRLTWSAATAVAGTLKVTDNLLTLATGAVAAQNNGMYIDFNSATGSSQINVFIQGNQIVSNNVSGILIEKAAAGTLLVTGTIDSNNISGNTNNGIHLNHVAAATSMSLNLAITNNNISGNATAAGNAGILSAGAAAAVNFTQGTLIIANNTISNNANFAIDIQLTGTNILGSTISGNSFFNNGTGARYITNTATVLLDLQMTNNVAVSTGFALTRTLGTFQAHLSNNTGPLAIIGGVTLLP